MRPAFLRPAARRCRPSNTGGGGPDGERDAYLRYVDDGHPVNWSAELEEMHLDHTREHFIDVWTRRAMLDRLGKLPAGAMIVDLGCSSGYLLEDLRRAEPDAQLIGVDLIGVGTA